jgi:hypothetical protein
MDTFRVSRLGSKRPLAAPSTDGRYAGLTGLMQMRHDPSLWRRRRYMLRAAVQRNFSKADVHAGLNTIAGTGHSPQTHRRSELRDKAAVHPIGV